jgi:uncharacterized glyoxalase superfamily protein PhnB
MIPMLAYEDGVSAIEWLCSAFGFEERADARAMNGGVVIHAELHHANGVVFVATPSPDYRGPKRHAAECEQAARWLDNPWVVDGVFVEVDDVDAHHAHAVEHGATILRELDDPGVGFRVYTAEDPEGHRWMFGQRSQTVTEPETPNA